MALPSTVSVAFVSTPDYEFYRTFRFKLYEYPIEGNASSIFKYDLVNMRIIFDLCNALEFVPLFLPEYIKRSSGSTPESWWGWGDLFTPFRI